MFGVIAVVFIVVAVVSIVIVAFTVVAAVVVTAVGRSLKMQIKQKQPFEVNTPVFQISSCLCLEQVFLVWIIFFAIPEGSVFANSLPSRISKVVLGAKNYLTVVQYPSSLLASQTGAIFCSLSRFWKC